VNLTIAPPMMATVALVEVREPATIHSVTVTQLDHWFDGDGVTTSPACREPG
jgi:hypothetical protein